MAFGGRLGRWSVARPLKSDRPGYFLGALGHHLVDLGTHCGAHWILKGSLKWAFFDENQHKTRKRGPRKGFETTWFLDWFLMPAWEARNGKKRGFALYLLQSKRFSRSRNLKENGSQKASQINQNWTIWDHRINLLRFWTVFEIM